MKRRTGHKYYSSDNNSTDSIDTGSTSVANAFKEAEKIAGRIFKLFDKGAGDIVSAFSSALNIVQQIISLMQPVEGSSSIFSSIFSFIPGLSVLEGIFGGRASGGSVSASVPYIVGEQGPELFIPDVNGIIIPGSLQSASQPIIDEGKTMGDYISGAGSSNVIAPNITVIVQSEVEASKAVRFFNNHFPNYENRRGKENFT